MTGKLRLDKVRPVRYMQFVTIWNILNLHLLELENVPIFILTLKSRVWIEPDSQRSDRFRSNADQIL